MANVDPNSGSKGRDRSAHSIVLVFLLLISVAAYTFASPRHIIPDSDRGGGGASHTREAELEVLVSLYETRIGELQKQIEGLEAENQHLRQKLAATTPPSPATRESK